MPLNFQLMSRPAYTENASITISTKFLSGNCRMRSRRVCLGIQLCCRERRKIFWAQFNSYKAYQYKQQYNTFLSQTLFFISEKRNCNNNDS